MDCGIWLRLQGHAADIAESVKVTTGLMGRGARVEGWHAFGIKYAEFVGAGTDYRGFVVLVVGESSGEAIS